MALRTTSSSLRRPSRLTFRCSIISSSCWRTSRALRSAFTWRNCLLHHSPRNWFCRHCVYTLSSVRWSLSGTKKRSRAWSASSSRPAGRKKTGGTLSIDTMVRISPAQPEASPKSSILDSGGSSGNSTIFLPVCVRFAWSSSAPSTHSEYIAFRRLSSGGGSMKSKPSRSPTLSDLSSRTTLLRFVRWISGMALCSSSLRKALSVYSR
mmetsp:Transcript_2573/g.10285  ORF Transcript_2573/g.10285 Transcript_2573/m.10285 type:complete len:208 (-) Transcript_2573:82-705(-)